MATMLKEIISSVVDESLDWFFLRLQEHYDQRRRLGSDSNPTSSLAIDYILNIKYPPESATKWVGCYKGASKQKSFDKLLILYLKLDMENFLSQKTTGINVTARQETTKQLKDLKHTLKILTQIPFNHDFHNSIVHLSQGLWAVDNGFPSMIVLSLSNPSVKLSNLFDEDDQTGDLLRIITESLMNSNYNRMALFINNINRQDLNSDGSDLCNSKSRGFDRLYTLLLISCGQLVEALKYVRSLNPDNGRENQDYNSQHAPDHHNDEYTVVLHEFVELCSQWNVIKSLNSLNLTQEEEEILNNYSIAESRPITPVSTSSQVPRPTKSTTKSKPKPRNRNIQVIRRIPSFNDSPARNTRSARKKTEK